MLPPTRQRILILAAIAVATCAWLAFRGWLVPGDLSSGISLGAASSGWFGAVTAVVLAGGVTLAVALVPGAAGHPLAGVFAAGIGLCVLAGWGGPIDGWMRRSALPGAYAGLIVESLVWHGGMLGLAWCMWKLRPPVRRLLPGVVCDPRHEALELPGRPDRAAVLAGLTAAAVGGGVCWVLQRSTSEGQVIGTMIAAFTLAGLAAQYWFPDNRHVLAVLAAPLVVSVAAYAAAWLMFPHEQATLTAWFNLGGFDRHAARMPGPALVLPIYYASAGMAGAAMGAGMAGAIHAARAAEAGHGDAASGSAEAAS